VDRLPLAAQGGWKEKVECVYQHPRKALDTVDSLCQMVQSAEESKTSFIHPPFAPGSIQKSRVYVFAWS
jgi:hypothetical protein